MCTISKRKVNYRKTVNNWIENLYINNTHWIQTLIHYLHITNPCVQQDVQPACTDGYHFYKWCWRHNREIQNSRSNHSSSHNNLNCPVWEVGRHNVGQRAAREAMEGQFKFCWTLLNPASHFHPFRQSLPIPFTQTTAVGIYVGKNLTAWGRSRWGIAFFGHSVLYSS